MNFFNGKVRTICMCNLVVPFVCTGFLGIKTNNGIITGSTTNEAHEISLTASDTEPASQYGEGEDSDFAFITDGIEAIINQQELADILDTDEEENDFAFITEGLEAIIDQQEKALNELKEVKKVENKTTVKKTVTKKSSSKKTTTSKSTSVVTKKEVAKSTSYEKPSNTSKTGVAVVEYALKFKGLRYKHGTPSLSSGADCSGFTMLIYRQFGISLPRTVGGQKSKGKAVSKSDLQKGDLVFFKPKGCKNCSASHVAIYIGGGRVIHETRPGRGVAITGIDGLSNIQYVTARRVINSSTAKTTETKKETKTDTTVNTTPTATPNVSEEKNESVNNDVVDNNVTATPSATITPSVETVQEVKTDTPKEEVKVEETPKVEVKVETTPAAENEVKESTSTKESN